MPPTKMATKANLSWSQPELHLMMELKRKDKTWKQIAVCQLTKPFKPVANEFCYRRRFPGDPPSPCNKRGTSSARILRLASRRNVSRHENLRTRPPRAFRRNIRARIWRNLEEGNFHRLVTHTCTRMCACIYICKTLLPTLGGKNEDSYTLMF